MKPGILIALPLALLLLAVACGDTTSTQPTSTEPITVPTTPSSTPTPTWSELASLSGESPAGDRYNSEFKSAFFTPTGGAMRIQWAIEPLADYWNVGMMVFRKGQTPDNSTGASVKLVGLVWIEPGTEYAGGGTKTFSLKPGKQYYIWTQIWRCEVRIAVGERE